MEATAVILHAPERLSVAELALSEPGEEDVVVDVDWSGVSTGTERLFWSGRMPNFPGMGYPLVPGYEAVGRVVEAGRAADLSVGDRVFVPGASCYGDVRGLFGGSASRLVTASTRAVPIDGRMGEEGALLALAATAYHAMAGSIGVKPSLIVGHGVLGRLLARLTVLIGGAPPVVWERAPERMGGAVGYEVVHPDEDERRDYAAIYDVSGDAGLLDQLIARLAPGGEIVLAGFYADPLRFAFPPAFMREARIRVAAEWREPDVYAVRGLIDAGKLSLDGLITHRESARGADAAYRTAFDDAACLKMVLDWRAC